MLARTGKADEANRILADLQARREKTGVGAFHIAMVYAGFGDLDQTFAWLNKSIDAGRSSASSWVRHSGSCEAIPFQPPAPPARTRVDSVDFS